MIKKLTKDNAYLLILFVIATSFFFTQHALLLSWDFSSYVMNTHYIFSNGDYFEVYRAPLAPLLLAPSILFPQFGEYVFILQISILFLFASVSFSDTLWKKSVSLQSYKKEFVRFIFYIFILSPFTIFYATQSGTELLALAFLILFISELLRGNVSGHLLALGFLSRYNLIYFAPLLLLNKSPRKIIKNFLTFAIITISWFLYNYSKFGNAFASIVDSYALNILFRQEMIEQFKLTEILSVTSVSIVFAALGIIASILIILKDDRISKEKLTIFLIALITLVIFYDFLSTPFKFTRYLYNLALPLAFFSMIGFFALLAIDKKSKKILVLILVFIFTFQITLVFLETIKYKDTDTQFFEAARDLEALGLENCLIRSPHWVMVRYTSGGILPLGDYSFEELIQQNATILLFNDLSTYDDSFSHMNISNYPIIYETNEYKFIGNFNITKETCFPREKFDEAFVKDHCEILSDKFTKLKLNSLALKTCRFLNLQESNL